MSRFGQWTGVLCTPGLRSRYAVWYISRDHLHRRVVSLLCPQIESFVRGLMLNLIRMVALCIVCKHITGQKPESVVPSCHQGRSACARHGRCKQMLSRLPRTAASAAKNTRSEKPRGRQRAEAARLIGRAVRFSLLFLTALHRRNMA